MAGILLSVRCHTRSVPSERRQRACTCLKNGIVWSEGIVLLLTGPSTEIVCYAQSEIEEKNAMKLGKVGSLPFTAAPPPLLAGTGHQWSLGIAELPG